MKDTRTLLYVLLLSLISVQMGCGLDTRVYGEPFDAAPADTGPEGGMDAGPDAETDSGPADAGPDAGPDSGPDAGPDSGPADAGSDSGTDAGPDAETDSGPADAGPDSGTDSGPADSGTDGGTDAGPPSPCADRTVEYTYPGGGMVTCDGAETQCDAGTLCGPGWHLCVSIEYILNGGRTVMATGNYWQAACIRRACTPAGSIDGLCGSCDGSTGSDAELAYTCTGGAPFSSNDCHVGVITDPTGSKLISTGSLCQYSQIAGTHERHGALCCN